MSLAEAALADFDDLLVKTSRTFALSIPLLGEPTRREVTLAYLLFRIADTFEDAYVWPQNKRIEALNTFASLLDRPADDVIPALAEQWARDQPSESSGYLELLLETPAVLEAYAALDPAAREVVGSHTARTARGMAGYVARSTPSGDLQLQDVADLKEYCYVVAGIVGEMLTELFLLGGNDLEVIAAELRERAAAFGEALQLVNILKDSATDAREGRCYLPLEVPRAEIFALARHDLTAAVDYVLALQRAGANRGVVAFTALPVQLAWATLVRVEESGAGSKLTRAEVLEITQGLNRALDQNEPAVGVG